MEASRTRTRRKNPTREAWLARVTELLRPQFAAAGYPLPPNIRASIGFPSGRERTTAAEAWSRESSEDQHYEIFVHPRYSDPVEIIAHMEHELTHVALDLRYGHTGPFRVIMRSFGYRGSMMTTTVSRMTDEGRARLRFLAEQLGPIPHGALRSDLSGTRPGGRGGRGDQEPGDEEESEGDRTTSTGAGRPSRSRLIRLRCSDCGYIVYTTRKWIENPGPVHCPVHGAMDESPAAESGSPAG